MAYISYTELEEAFTVSRDNVDRLLKDAKYLHDQSKYPNSIALAILSYEELAKLHFIIQRQIEKKDITKSEWKSFASAGSHENKLTRILKDSHTKAQKITKEQYEAIAKREKRFGSNIQYRTFEEFNQNIDMGTRRLAKLNLIKQYCWYLERTNKEFVTISEIYNKNNLKVLSYWLIKIVFLEFLTTLLNKKYPVYWMWTIPKEISILRNDSLYITHEGVIKEVYSKQFRSISGRAVLMIDTFPKRLEDLQKQSQNQKS